MTNGSEHQNSLVRAADGTPWVRSVHLAPPTFQDTDDIMSKLLRGVAAGYGAKKLGGGCFSTVIIFIILWWVLGHFGIFR
jgi:hypothetical protein